MFLIIQRNNIIAISDTIGYQHNGNVVVDGGLAIARPLVTSIIETDILPDCWEKVNGFYVRKEVKPTIITKEEVTE